MATTKSDISRWFREGVKQGASHLIVVVDTFDYEDYPKFIMPGEDINQIVTNYNLGKFEMQRIVEVYKLSMDMESQLSEHRAFHQ